MEMKLMETKRFAKTLLLCAGLAGAAICSGCGDDEPATMEWTGLDGVPIPDSEEDAMRD